MDAFSLYLRLGFEHISDLSGYDHILFVIALAAVYPLREWKHLLVLVTAFTIGHSITLALATMGWVDFNPDLIETLIPVTIFITAAINVAERFAHDPEKVLERDWRMKYVLAIGFGLIHGLGFSNFLRAILGSEESMILPLFSFNVGLEIGQLVILVITFLASGMMIRLANLLLERMDRPVDNTQRNWAALLSSVIAIMALNMIWS